MPQLGATFVPGGFDDYYMPEVFAPSPQRVMPEVPQNMQEDLQRMELEARELGNNTTSPASSGQHGHHDRQPSLSTFLNKHNGPADASRTSDRNRDAAPPSQAAAASSPDFKPFKDDKSSYQDMSSQFDGPSFSPFPKVKGDNVPPSDEEKEEILYNARSHVLHSNNVPMQLSWARDALSWVETATEAYDRERENNGQARPQTPKVEHDLRVDATNIVNYLAGQGHPEALFMRSKWLEFGKFNFRPDKKEAYLGYKKAAEQGWGRAEYRMGMLYENSNDMEKAIKHYNQGLAMKDSAALYRLGMMSLLGQHGFPKDYQRGLQLIQSAADTSDEDAPQGAFVYGMLIARDLPDINIPEGMLQVNMGLARQYIEKAAYLGFGKAQLKMGQAYELCQLGCDFNPAYSLHYYGLAARQGQPEAALGVSRWFLFGYEGVFQKNEQLAFKYAQEAASAKLGTGEFAMGYYHEIGIHVQKNIREARNWYEKAAEHGNKDAVQRLESLSQSKTLTKQDHETTTLTRIKSQHGSQRGKRPERFKQNPAAMPTVTESAPTTPTDSQSQPFKGVSPGKSPKHAATAMGDNFDMPDPSRHSTMNNPRQPAFTLNLDQNLAMRPKSAAPYPEDDRPAPLNLSRPKSTAPYPEDEMLGGRPSQLRPNQGPIADRPSSAFGIRTTGGLPQSHSTGNLAPIPPAGSQPPRGSRIVSAGWEPQGGGGGGYRNDYHGQAPYDHGGPPRQPLGPGAGGPPAVDPSRNRLQKTNPNSGSPAPGPQGQYPPGGYGAQGGQPPIQPGRDYGPRNSSRPVSDMYDRTPSASMSGALGPGSLPSQQGQRLPSAGRPAHLVNDMGGRSSAPPLGLAGNTIQRPSSGGSIPSIASTTAAHGGASRPPAGRPGGGGPAPPAKPQGQGPATFEAMGIPQGKNESDCVVM